MGTNRRSRRRSAARILNSSMNSKRPRMTPDQIEDSTPSEFPPTDDVSDPASSPLHGCTTPNPDHSLPFEEHPGNVSNDLNLPSPVDVTTAFNIPSSDSLCSNPKFTQAEICSYELMNLLDDAGCPLNTYEQVVSLLKKQEKCGFSYSMAHSRDKLLDLLRQKFHCPSIQSSIVHDCEVFSFPFLDMLQDLLNTAGRLLHTICPNNVSDTDELWNSNWMQQTFASPPYANFNAATDVMLPIILYLDKTGTD